MEDSSSTQEGPKESRERYVYLLPQDGIRQVGHGDISLLDLWDTLWQAKWYIIAVSILFVSVSVPYALLQTEWYRADTLLIAADERSSDILPAQLGGLASLSGMRISSGITEPLAILRSREFSRAFIDEHNLLPVFYSEQWDAEGKTWIGDDPDLQPDMQDAIRMFREDVLSVGEGTDAGLVTFSVEWTDPELAATWANMLVARLNEHMRQRALSSAQANVDYLQNELAKTNVVTLQQSIGRLLETELQKLMLARGNDEFAFRVIDPAEPPKLRVRPNRSLIVITAGMLGGMLSVFIVFTVSAIRRLRRQHIRATLPLDDQ